MIYVTLRKIIFTKYNKKYIHFISKPPIWDTAGDSVELNFIQTKREHEAMLILQKESLEEINRQANANELRTHRLQKIQTNLRKKMIETNIFMRECEEKRLAAEKKVAEELRTHAKLYKNIEKQKNSKTVLAQFRRTLRETIHEYNPYEDVMSEVVKSSDIFVSHKDCMDRCDALSMKKVFLVFSKSLTFNFSSY